MTNWSEIKSGIINLLGPSDSENEDKGGNIVYLDELVKGLEKKVDFDFPIRFRIEQIKTNGVSVKVNGLFAYLSYMHMPWKYPNLYNWQAVAPTLLGKIFYGKVINLQKAPLFIIMNGESHTFKKIDLAIGNLYNAIILNKTSYGFFVDIGYHFDWEFGSFVGLIHNSNIPEELMAKKKAGDIIETYYIGINSNNQYVFGNNDILCNWNSGDPHQLLGQTVSAKISKENNKLKIIVDGKYKGTLPVSGEIYQNKKINYAIRNLQEDDVIECEVFKVNDVKMSLQLKWTSEKEIDEIYSRTEVMNSFEILNEENKKKCKNTIANNIMGGNASKLNFIGKTVYVEVEKNDSNINYIVENQHKAKLTISNKTFLITENEKELIERNLQDGEILSCEAIGISGKFIKVRWFINDDDLQRFLKQKTASLIIPPSQID